PACVTFVALAATFQFAVAPDAGTQESVHPATPAKSGNANVMFRLPKYAAVAVTVAVFAAPCCEYESVAPLVNSAGSVNAACNLLYAAVREVMVGVGRAA